MEQTKTHFLFFNPEFLEFCHWGDQFTGIIICVSYFKGHDWVIESLSAYSYYFTGDCRITLEVELRFFQDFLSVL